MVGGRLTHRGWLGSMLGKSILPPTDEELGKKDDDHKPGAHGRAPARNWPVTLFRWRRRRLLLAVVGVYLAYLLFKNMPALGLSGPRTPQASWDAVVAPTDEQEPTGPPPGSKAPAAGSPQSHEYNGEIRLYRLADTLHAASHTYGYHPTNRNVLFVVSSLKSASALLPMICEMSKWNRNYVHAAFVGREDIPLPDLLEINGVDKTECPAFWHDARPDYVEYSSDERAESSVKVAMMHIQRFLHPQVAIMDDARSEDGFFVRGIRAKAKAYNIPLIEIPKDRWQNFLWITRLDAGSLRSWHKPTVDIVIQAPSDSSGGVLRLLRSLKDADYSGMKPPRLAIELPADVDRSFDQYLRRFTWPPENSGPVQSTSAVTIRRRITSPRTTQEDSAIRVLETFYPTTSNSHVLLLSPNAELSPLYYHYLNYVLLEYKYSSYPQDGSANLMGVSLERPSVLLDGKTGLTPPSPADMQTTRYSGGFPGALSTQFLWQAPNSHAALFFGDKWAELHSFLNNRVAKQHQAPKVAARPKAVSETFPAWTEYILEYMRARGYSLLYPATSGAESLVTVHSEVYRVPEEFSHSPHGSEEPDSDGANTPRKLPNEAFLRAETPPPQPSKLESTVIPHSRPLHLALPFDGDLPEILHLPHLSTSGELVTPEDMSSTASAYADDFRKSVGGCKIPEGKHRRVEPGNAKDLFCFGGEDEDDWEDDVSDNLDLDVIDENVTVETIEAASTAIEGTATASAAPGNN